MKRTLSVAILLLLAQWSLAQKNELERHWPRPSNIPNLLFYILRDPDSNTVCYTANLSRDGKPDANEPISIFWIRYAEDGKRKELTAFQRKFGYGLKSRQVGPDSVALRMVALPARLLYLTKDQSGRFLVQTTINGKRCRLERIYIRIEGGSSLSPDISYIELTGKQIESGRPQKERISVSK